MKNGIFTSLLFALLFSAGVVTAQDKDSVLDILKAPSSPAASILGISPSDVQRPTDPSAFSVSLQNATSNFSVLPSSYAVDIAPAWLLTGHNITFNQFIDSQSVWKSVKQSFVLSAALTSNSDSDVKAAALGFGMKFSILRGAVNQKTLEAVRKSQSLLSHLGKAVSDAVNAFVLTDVFANASVADQKAMIDSVTRAVHTESDQLKELVKSMDFSRHGWKLDVAGGLSINYPNQKFNSGTVGKAGAWITGGYETEDGFSALAILRYLYNPDKIFADEDQVLHQDNLSTFDAGLRVIYDSHNKFTVSGEAIYRSVLQKTEVKPTYRFTFNADYKIAPNRILTLALGRDYDGTFNKDGNLIAALNLLVGFGNNRGRP